MEAKSEERCNPLLYLFSKTWQYSLGNRRNVVRYWAMFIIANSIAFVGEPLIISRVMKVLQEKGVTHESFWELMTLVGILVIIETAFWTFHAPARCIERKNAFKARATYRMFLLRGIMTLPMEWHVDHHSGDTIDRIEKGTSALFSFAEDSFQVIWGVVDLLVIIIMIIIFGNWMVVTVVLLAILVSAGITMRFDRKMMPQYDELNEADNKISESVTDAITNITTVIILRVERLVYEAIRHKVERPYDLFSRNQRLGEMKWFLNSLCIKLMMFFGLAAFFWGNMGAAPGSLIASGYLLVNYLARLGDNFYRFTSMYADIIRNRSRVENAEKLARDFRSESLANHVLPKDWQRLKVSGLNFAYQSESNGRLHLEDISFSLERGRKYAVVGKSGDGKSTLFSLMIDLFHASDFSLEIDGREVKEGFRGICRGATLVPQKPDLFANTIFWNVTMGAEHELDFVRRFTDMACFTEVAEALPKKFDSSIKERGVNLSGGEQQRLALARGLLACHDKDVVLLDEPTSSLDTATEMKVYRNIFREFRDKTILSSVHRLHLLPMFDKIYMFGNGRIIASGTLQELLATSLEFQKLWRQYHEHRGGDSN
jgi:ATP-binding cassette subfamily B protein